VTAINQHTHTEIRVWRHHVCSIPKHTIDVEPSTVESTGLSPKQRLNGYASMSWVHNRDMDYASCTLRSSGVTGWTADRLPMEGHTICRIAELTALTLSTL
jgi:hypothetical protein